MLARSPGNLIEVNRESGSNCHMCGDYNLFDEFYSLKQILEVMFGNAGIRSESATVVLDLTSVGSKVRSCKLSACRKTCWACERQQRSKGGNAH